MTKFEKIAMRAAALEKAYNAIIDYDNWENMTYEEGGNFSINDERIEQHEFCLSIAKEIEKLL